MIHTDQLRTEHATAALADRIGTEASDRSKNITDLAGDGHSSFPKDDSMVLAFMVKKQLNGVDYFTPRFRAV